MIKGAPYWNDRTRYYIQTNNAIEAVLSDYLAREDSVACGPTSAVNCLASIGESLTITTPNGWTPQPEDVFLLWFHDFRNYDEMERIRKETSPHKTIIPPNEVPQYYPAAVRAVFGKRCRFEWISNFDRVSAIVSGGSPVMVALKKPGHYIAIVAYDDGNQEMIYHDSYPPFHRDGNGFACRLTRKVWEENVKPFVLIFG